MLSDSQKPVYKRLFEMYKNDILSFRLQPGERVESIVEMQQKYTIGRETAKKVLGLLAQKGFIVKHRGKGSFVTDQRPPQKVLGLVLPHYSIQYENLLQELGQHLQAEGREFHHFCHYNNYEEEIRLVGHMLHERYEAVVVIPTLDESRTWKRFYSNLQSGDSSILLLNHTMTSNDFRYVIQSYDLGVTRAINHMLKSKPGMIVFIENDILPGRNMVLELMRGTYLEMMRTRRPDDEPILLKKASDANLEDFRERGVTGIFCCDDICAIQTIGRLIEQGAQFPGELLAVSYGNTELCRFFTPPITSVDPHNAEIAATLCKLLYHSEQYSETIFRQHVIHPTLAIRGT